MMADTLAERLHALIARLAPSAAAEHAAAGTWPNREADPGQKRNGDGELELVDGKPVAARHSGAPYAFETLSDGRRRLTIHGDDGDVIGAVGATIPDAVAAMEIKLGPAAEGGAK